MDPKYYRHIKRKIQAALDRDKSRSRSGDADVPSKGVPRKRKKKRLDLEQDSESDDNGPIQVNKEPDVDAEGDSTIIDIFSGGTTAKSPSAGRLAAAPDEGKPLESSEPHRHRPTFSGILQTSQLSGKMAKSAQATSAQATNPVLTKHALETSGPTKEASTPETNVLVSGPAAGTPMPTTSAEVSGSTSILHKLELCRVAFEAVHEVDVQEEYLRLHIWAIETDLIFARYREADATYGVAGGTLSRRRIGCRWQAGYWKIYVD